LSRPVFFDPSGRRRRWTRRFVFLGLILFVAVAIGFATTVVHIPVPSPLPLGLERRTALPMRAQVSRLSNSIKNLFAAPPKVRANSKGQTITVAFYTTWSDVSAPSLVRHINQVDWVAPTSLNVTLQGKLEVGDDRAMRRIVLNAIHRPLIVPVLQNVDDNGFSRPAAEALFRSKERRRALITQVLAYLDKTGDAGIIFDFEDLSPQDMPAYRGMIAEVNEALNKKGRVVAVTLPMEGEGWSPNQFAAVADKIILMAYDEHWASGAPGPIASTNWFAAKVAKAIKGMPANKVIIALGSYAYDWHPNADGKNMAESMTVEEAWLAAHDSATKPVYDKVSGNSGFSFLENGQRHDVWIIDAAASWNQMRILSQLGVGNVALWRLGTEDPGFWPALGSWRAGKDSWGKTGNTPAAPLPDLTTIKQAANADVEGTGEILRITSVPTDGKRAVQFDTKTHLVSDFRYDTLPTPYKVERTGYAPKKVALTFDDGPDQDWTPRILTILEQYKVPATFFVIGENGVSNREILQRMIKSGMEIGNHSYTHPDMANSSDTAIRLELNATQRLVEAYTGRSMRLFRAPYFGDAEPTTADELVPAAIAQERGYTVVGLHVDSADWKAPGVQKIIDNTLRGVHRSSPAYSGNIVLLHDGGGNREQTIAALPGIITALRQEGYQFVSVADLAGLTRDQVMPPVEGYNLAAVRADVFMFTMIGASIVGLNWTFFFAIALGVLRSVSLVALAMLRPKRKAPIPDGTFRPKVTVIIPCFNEEKVIATSVLRILESSYPYLDVIVADDGSKDGTSAVVQEKFGDNPRVKLMTMPNGGKAAALNRALAEADGEIIVALDADTQFERETIMRLVRWFIDPKVGAVAGNAKVGNRVNLVTRWQAVEYTTAQNIERRALTRFEAIMVVPGAVGAWRRTALESVGGYPEDTLAEDQDLTIAIQRKKWKIAYDEDAVAWTEAPESFSALAKQRFRWSYGTLQCLWKHRKVMRRGKPGGLAFIGIPQAWLFQILFACISPAIDLALVVSMLGTAVRVAQHGWAQTQTDVFRMGLYWIAFSCIDLVCGWIAFRLDVRDKKFRPFLLLSQRFVYRQVMYSVVLRAVAAAVRGVGTGWGKLERTGRVTAPEQR
jgi:cellulose synthase/poly-beta-1,6-N-acetylglucosamine synthase-like glycosyltransferase/peptidoglycan/xylan/chitin deacetylase (PgdA/CDA1 family)/spore germination protein YaaH